MTRLLIALIFLGSYGLVKAGGPWPQPKGKAYLKLSEWWLVADQHYTDQGLKDPNITTGLFNTAMYAEYGITDRLTGIVYFPFFSRSYFNNQKSATTGQIIKDGEAINTIGDMDVALKFGLTRNGSSLPVSISLLLGVPTGESAGGSEGALQTGDGEFNQMLRVDVGGSFGSDKTAIYLAGYGAFNNRTNDFSDELRGGLELGFGLMNSKLWMIGRLDGVYSLKNGATAADNNTASIFANNAEYLNVGLEANYYITDKLGVSVGGTMPVIGKIVYAAPAFSVGVFMDLSK